MREMAQFESRQVPRLKGDLRSVADPLPSAGVRPWRSRIKGHLTNCKYIYVLVVLALYSGSILRAHIRGDPRNHILDDEFVLENKELWTEWQDITPSEKLKWQPCFRIYGPNLQCARLTVPMDYGRPLNESADHPRVHLALTMATGTGRTQDPSTYAEAPLLINPGGPGGSGAWFVQARAKSLQLFVGDQHDIIGFDPRGVGASTPKADCFASPNSSNGVLGRNVAYMNRLTWTVSGNEIGLINSSDVALTKLSARGRAVAQLCQRADESEGDGSIFRHMGTTNSARDMLSIVHAWDEWRSSSYAPQAMRSSPTPPEEPQTPDDGEVGEDGSDGLRGKLVYWGFSYGTYLGATFASMFPDNVGRIVLDGVIQADHYTDLTWEGSLVDADAIWHKFFVYCAEVGSPCSFYRNGDGPEDIKRRFSEALSLLEKQPAAVILPDTNLPALVTASDVKKSIFFGGLYAPTVGFPVIADLLNHIVHGSLGKIAKGEGMVLLCGNLTLPVWPDDAMRGIACGDKRQKFDEDISELRSRFERATSYSWFADVWFGTEPNLGCNGWEIESKGHSTPWDNRLTHGIKTSFPILVLSNTLDPVTPLDDALYMTRKFANASIVEQDGLGHCSISCISGCTIAHLRAYLNEGVVPPPPRFKDDFGNDGEWPTCRCLDRPWARSGYAAEELTTAFGPLVDRAQTQAYQELRAHLSAFVLSHHLESTNPLKRYLMERSGLTAGY